MKLPAWITHRYVWQIGMLLAALLVMRLLGFKGACQHLADADSAANSGKAFQGPKPGVDLLHNSYLDVQDEKPYTVVFFLSRECPLCKNYRPLIRRLEAEFSADPRIGFVTLRTDSEQAQDSTYFTSTEFTAGKAAKQIAGYFGATVTPEVFVVDSANRIVYRGAIDNWAYETGRHRPEATEHYLYAVLDAIRKGQTPAFSENKAYGCFIE